MNFRNPVLALLMFGLALSAGVQSAYAQITPIARLSCSASSYPSCGGWSARPESSYFTRQLLPGGGPTGQDTVLFNLTPVSSHAQFYLGWGTSVPGTPQGGTRYIRLRIRILAPLNVTAHQPEGAWTDKFIVLGDGGDSSSRVIIELRPGSSSSTLATRAQRNIDGDPNRTPLTDHSLCVWHSLQWEIRSSSSSGAADGRLRFWQNGQNANFASPTSQSGNFPLSTAHWSNINLGHYSNASLAGSGRVSFEIAGFEYDDQFDPTWNQSSPGGTLLPSAPGNLRIAGADLGLLSLLVYAVARLRRRGPDAC